MKTHVNVTLSNEFHQVALVGQMEGPDAEPPNFGATLVLYILDGLAVNAGNSDGPLRAPYRGQQLVIDALIAMEFKPAADVQPGWCYGIDWKGEKPIIWAGFAKDEHGLGDIGSRAGEPEAALEWMQSWSRVEKPLVFSTIAGAIVTTASGEAKAPAKKPKSLVDLQAKALAEAKVARTKGQ